MTSNAILVFEKQPFIHRSHGHEPFAALPWDDLDALFTAFVSDLLGNASKVAKTDVLFYKNPAMAVDEFLYQLGDRVTLCESNGASFSARVSHGVQDAFTRGYQRILVVLDNQPTLSPRIFGRLLDQLNYEHECLVVGPTTEGTYYLIGMKADQSEIFNVSGTDPLASPHELLRRLCRVPGELFLAPTRYLLDTGYNLERLYLELEATEMRDTSFPLRTYEIFKKFDRKYRTKYAAR